MKSRIASALAVLACVGALAACSGKGSAGTGGTAPAGAGVTATTTAPGASGASSESSVGRTDSQGVAGDPDGDLSSIDQQLSDINGALSSAEPTQTAGDN
ncbi:hypothetical protein ABH935_005471 [Catenulispora sp. GAS73]|uniref:hypothetical protein n=1 Tax=Catenulispora sp. GAS73 TaxID=3156269 RepID=UPI003512D66A